jgi:hypothetical protein
MCSMHERKFKARSAGVEQWGAFQLTVSRCLQVENPFFDVLFKGEFTAPSGSQTQVEGFYDGDNTWKLRFCPDEVGDWQCRATLEAAGVLKEVETSFECIPSDLPGPLSIHPANPRHFMNAKKQAVYLFGFRCFHIAEPWYVDGLKRERPAVDWTDRDAMNYAATRISRYTTEDYLEDLALHGMNLVSIDTTHYGRYAAPHNTLWPRSGLDADGMGIYNIRDRYDLCFARRLDEILRYAGRIGVYVKLIPFCGCTFWEYHPLSAKNGGPCKSMSHLFVNEEAQQIMDRYYQYIVNRYAAYYNVLWEVGNELWHGLGMWGTWEKRMAEFLRAHDPYRRLIMADSYGDIISFHWAEFTQESPLGESAYEPGHTDATFCGPLPKTGLIWYPAGDEYNVDKVLYEKMSRYMNDYPGQAIINDECMFRGRTYQRLAIWASFMAGGSLSSMDHPKYEIHTDPEVMADHLHLSEFVAQLDLTDITPDNSFVKSYDAAKLRAYGLIAQNQYVVYLHHYSDHVRPVVDEQITIRIPVGRYSVRWYNSSTGRYQEEGLTVDVAEGEVTLPIPEFVIDQVLHAVRM